MSLEVKELGPEHDAALRNLLSVEALRNLRLLDAWEEASIEPGRHYGLFSGQRLLAAALVEPSSGHVLPSACAPDHARALGTSLAGTVVLRSSLGDRLAVEALLGSLCSSKPRQLVAHRLFTASPDHLGPFLTRALRLANEDDGPRLVQMNAAELAESFDGDPPAESAEVLEARVLHRIRRRRTWVLELEGSLATKVDVGAQTRFGAELEGVYTLPEHRFRGCATLALGQLSRNLLSSTPRLTLRIADSADGLLAVARKVGYLGGSVQQLLAIE